MYEAFPQLCLQLYFLIKTTFYRGSVNSGNFTIFIFSIIFSIFSISIKAVSEDKPFIKENDKVAAEKDKNAKINKYNKYGKNCFCKKNFVNSKKHDPDYKCCFKVSYWWIFRCGFRVLDVVSRIFVLILTWILLGGFWLILVLSIEFITIILLSCKTKEFSLSLRKFFFCVFLLWTPFALFCFIFYALFCFIFVFWW